MLLALIFGVLAIREGARQQDHLVAVLDRANSHEESLEALRNRLEDEMSRAIRRVTDALQTVYIGSAPDFLPEITDLLSRATSSIAVLCDHPTYLMLSNGTAFDDYLRVVREKVAASAGSSPDMVAELIFLDDLEQRELDRNQYLRYARSTDSWRAWLKQQTRDIETSTGLEPGPLVGMWERTARICRSDSVVPTDLDLDGLVDRLAAADKAVKDIYLAGAEIHTLRYRDSAGNSTARYSGPTVFMWMRDAFTPEDAEAIFVLVPQGATDDLSREEAFLTRDPRLIRALLGIFERYKLAANQAGEQRDPA